jgi:hypothetical protein
VNVREKGEKGRVERESLWKGKDRCSETEKKLFSRRKCVESVGSVGGGVEEMDDGEKDEIGNDLNLGWDGWIQ